MEIIAVFKLHLSLDRSGLKPLKRLLETYTGDLGQAIGLPTISAGSKRE
ncbi:hypothetical protein [Rhizobium rhizogenes]|nr:hypothetical protein [Rhizobium rhizogenes]MCZ7464152.1 hypothetical protein [Rhizobium rhizogenes]